MGGKLFLAIIHREIKRSARESERRQKASQRACAAADRAAVSAKKREQLACAQSKKANAADQKRFEKEVKDSHYTSMAAEVARLNLELSEIAEDIDGILEATLDVDDFVDLETLRANATHPPFYQIVLLHETARPLPIQDTPAPTLVEPVAPRGIMAVFGKKNHEKSLAKAHARFETQMEEWKITLAQLSLRRDEEAALYEQRERQRLASLEQAREKYAAECIDRDQAAAEQNQAVDRLITNLSYGIPEAVEEYSGIVISNTIYPDHFPVKHEFSYAPDSAELTLRVTVPAPEQIGTVKTYKYNKATDEITAIQMPGKACKDRYASAIHQVALRTPHEVFEADRRGLIGSVSLEIGAYTTNPATGVTGFIPFVALGVGREEFLKLELSNVLPVATLVHLGASISKNPYELVSTNVTGVRRL
jgi:restriction system protein